MKFYEWNEIQYWNKQYWKYFLNKVKSNGMYRIISFGSSHTKNVDFEMIHERRKIREKNLTAIVLVLKLMEFSFKISLKNLKLLNHI